MLLSVFDERESDTDVLRVKGNVSSDIIQVFLFNIIIKYR